MGNIRRIGFIVNPVAGMGGKVGLKGTDGVAEEAVKLGAEPVSHMRALAFLNTMKGTLIARNIEWHTVSGNMGDELLVEAGFSGAIVDYSCPTEKTTAEDTKSAIQEFMRNCCDLVVFCGGDGTARDINSVLGIQTPVIGIPSGVKMHSAVFAVSPRAGAEILIDYLQGGLELQDCEILDLDEEQYRHGKWSVRLFGIARTPFEQARLQGGKIMFDSIEDDHARDAIAEYMADEILHDDDRLHIIGPGSTTQRLGEVLGIDKTLLGVDCILGNKLVGKDVSEKQILDLIGQHGKPRIVVSPIGAQGFIFGRGNLQISDKVLMDVSLDDIIVIATPGKLLHTPVLRIDLNSQDLMNRFTKNKDILVVTGNHLKERRPIAGPD